MRSRMNSAGMPRGRRGGAAGMPRGCRADAAGALAPSGQASPRSLRIMPEGVCADIDLPGGQWMQCGCGPRSARGHGSDLQRRPLPGGDLSAASRPRTRMAVGLPTHGGGWVNLPICDRITPAESSRGISTLPMIPGSWATRFGSSRSYAERSRATAVVFQTSAG